MSVLIPRMKLPDDCRECPMEQYYNYCGETRCEVNGMILAEDYRALSYDGRHEDCPLKEIKDGTEDPIYEINSRASQYEYGHCLIILTNSKAVDSNVGGLIDPIQHVIGNESELLGLRWWNDVKQ